MKAVVAAFNQEKALVGAFSVITNLRMQLFEALLDTQVRLGLTVFSHLTYNIFYYDLQSVPPGFCLFLLFSYGNA